MADAVAAGNEEHGYGRYAGHEERIMIGAADHAFVAFAGGFAGVFEGSEGGFVACSRWIGVDDLRADADVALRCGLVACGLDCGENAIAAGGVDVADIDFKLDARGDGVDCAGKDFADAGGCYGIDGSGGFGGGFYVENDFRGGGESIAARGHQHGSGVAAFAFDKNAKASGSGDVGDEADVDGFGFQGWTLLDVELDELMEAVGR